MESALDAGALATAVDRLAVALLVLAIGSLMLRDLASGIVLTSASAAEAAGVPQDKWVFVHAGATAYDEWFVSERGDLAASPAIRTIGRAALEHAGITADDAFTLAATYGFPIELTVELAEERGQTVDVDGFWERMEDHREVSRASGESTMQQIAAQLVGQRLRAPRQRVGGQHGPAPSARDAARHVPRSDQTDLHTRDTVPPAPERGFRPLGEHPHGNLALWASVALGLVEEALFDEAGALFGAHLDVARREQEDLVGDALHPAVEERDPLGAEMAQHEPAAGGGPKRRIVVDDDPIRAADAEPVHVTGSGP